MFPKHTDREEVEVNPSIFGLQMVFKKVSKKKKSLSSHTLFSNISYQELNILRARLEVNRCGRKWG